MIFFVVSGKASQRSFDADSSNSQNQKDERVDSVTSFSFQDGGNFSHLAGQNSSEMPAYLFQATSMAQPRDPLDTFMFRCKYCAKGYMSYTGLSLHLKVHQGKSFSCPICDKEFTQKGNMKTHMRMKHGACQCPQCSNVFTVGVEYDQHILVCKVGVGSWEPCVSVQL